MKAGSIERIYLFKHTIIIFIAFIIIDTIIRFYYIYFLNFETSPLAAISYVIPYIVLVLIVILYYQKTSGIDKQQRELVRRQLKRKGLPVRRRINTVTIKKKMKDPPAN